MILEEDSRENIIEANRIGKFTIADKLLRKSPLKILEAMSNFLVVEAKFSFYQRAVEYKAYSLLFDLVGIGFEIPEYEIVICSNGEVKAKKIQYGDSRQLIMTRDIEL